MYVGIRYSQLQWFLSNKGTFINYISNSGGRAGGAEAGPEEGGGRAGCEGCSLN